MDYPRHPYSSDIVEKLAFAEKLMAWGKRGIFDYLDTTHDEDSVVQNHTKDTQTQSSLQSFADLEGTPLAPIQAFGNYSPEHENVDMHFSDTRSWNSNLLGQPQAYNSIDDNFSGRTT